MGGLTMDSKNRSWEEMEKGFEELRTWLSLAENQARNLVFLTGQESIEERIKPESKAFLFEFAKSIIYLKKISNCLRGEIEKDLETQQVLKTDLAYKDETIYL